jgi:hypothetical protein
MRGMTSPAPLHDGRQLQLLIWESDVTTAGDGRVTLTARRPISHMSRRQAARVIGCSEWTVSDLYRMGLLNGYKPGARVMRSDGKASNAAVRLDSRSVLEYKAAREAESPYAG